ncbi:MAG: carbohydrate kinase family protein [Mycobacteriales bacterium]
MRIAVTGSIANDYLMTFPGRFSEQLIPDQLHRVSLSFLVDELDLRRGGVGANICYGMGQLGLRPILVGAVGRDWEDDRSWLDRNGVDTASVHISELKHTARFMCTTDIEQCQIASFYTGAMADARQIELRPVADRVGGLDLVVVSPNDPDAMLRHTAEAKSLGVPFAADPSQQLARMEGPAIRSLIEGAQFLFTNDYEATLVEQKTGWTRDEVLSKVEHWVVTLGAEGSAIYRDGQPEIVVPAVVEEMKADPTGVGDAFRAGFFSGRAWGLGLERCLQIGNLVATYVLERVGTQEYSIDRPAFIARFADAYGDEPAAELRANLK